MPVRRVTAPSVGRKVLEDSSLFLQSSLYQVLNGVVYGRTSPYRGFLTFTSEYCLYLIGSVCIHAP